LIGGFVVVGLGQKVLPLGEVSPWSGPAGMVRFGVAFEIPR